MANKNLTEPSSEVLVSRISGKPKWNMFLRVTRKPFGRFVIRLKSAEVRLVDPFEDLPRPITLDPEALDAILKLFQCQVEKIGHSAEPAGENAAGPCYNLAEISGHFQCACAG